MKAIPTAAEGLQRMEEHVQRIAARLARIPASDGSPQDVVELSAEVVSLLEAKNAHSANIQVIRTANEMDRNLLDILG